MSCSISSLIGNPILLGIFLITPFAMKHRIFSSLAKSTHASYPFACRRDSISHIDSSDASPTVVVFKFSIIFLKNVL